MAVQGGKLQAYVPSARRYREHKQLGQNDQVAPPPLKTEIRKDFTASECVAIAKAVEEHLGDRRRFHARGGPQGDSLMPQNFEESKPGQETRESYSFLLVDHAYH